MVLKFRYEFSSYVQNLQKRSRIGKKKSQNRDFWVHAKMAFTNLWGENTRPFVSSKRMSSEKITSAPTLKPLLVILAQCPARHSWVLYTGSSSDIGEGWAQTSAHVVKDHSSSRSQTTFSEAFFLIGFERWDIIVFFLKAISLQMLPFCYRLQT